MQPYAFFNDVARCRTSGNAPHSASFAKRTFKFEKHARCNYRLPASNRTVYLATFVIDIDMPMHSLLSYIKQCAEGVITCREKQHVRFDNSGAVLQCN